jgi:hypothetical protein
VLDVHAGARAPEQDLALHAALMRPNPGRRNCGRSLTGLSQVCDGSRRTARAPLCFSPHRARCPVPNEAGPDS